MFKVATNLTLFLPFPYPFTFPFPSLFLFLSLISSFLRSLFAFPSPPSLLIWLSITYLYNLPIYIPLFQSLYLSCHLSLYQSWQISAVILSWSRTWNKAYESHGGVTKPRCWITPLNAFLFKYYITGLKQGVYHAMNVFQSCKANRSKCWKCILNYHSSNG